MSPYRVEKLKISEIKEKVKEFAKEHEIILGEWVDIICVLDKSEINYVVVTAEEMGSDSVFGKYVPEEKTIYILQETYDNARDGDGPSRMTIAHEIGHYVLHKNGVVLENSTG
jgi:Zn-dependent peptidase ImmA (M78 family)